MNTLNPHDFFITVTSCRLLRHESDGYVQHTGIGPGFWNVGWSEDRKQRPNSATPCTRASREILAVQYLHITWWLIATLNFSATNLIPANIVAWYQQSAVLYMNAQLFACLELYVTAAMHLSKHPDVV